MKTARFFTFVFFALSLLSRAFGGDVLMPAAKADLLRRCFPLTEDRDLLETLRRPDLLLYTTDEMPNCFQANQGSLVGVFSVHQPIAANADPTAAAMGLDPHIGNVNLDPIGWAKPAGTEFCKGLRTFRFLALPRKSDGTLWPVAVWRTTLPQDSGPVYQWTFPEGTVVGEVLCHRGPDGKDYPFELRTREQYKTFWEPSVYRPFSTPDELAAAVAAHGKQAPAPHRLISWTVADRQPLRRVFRETAGVAFLPALNDDTLVNRLLLETPFKNVAGQPWTTEGDLTAHAPSTKADWHIVPKDYLACMVEVSAMSCARCHENTSLHATDFARNGTGKNLREWYGRSKGCAGVFSFHPFALESISRNGAGQGVRLRRELIDAGIIANYDPKQHPADRYRRIAEFDAATRSKPEASIKNTVNAR